MKSKLITKLILLVFILTSCQNKTYEERINKTKLIEGEYYSELNSQNGISVRENKIAFFEKMKFNSEDIYEYVIVDSILTEGNVENKIGTYLKRTDRKNTLYTKFTKLLDSTIILNRNNQSEEFKLKTRIEFK
ncbi:hypothetical protein [Flavobacterium sandaracinum]|uniref:Lipoprotein n=1 Tax=Flavobacterium sandaracinum TaxID=2541733 RepID=A0A4R5CN90_9FLAO|nr:hypothetical protein [Flavobacterium sandaracinum]TDE01869.1 hypothetical protein E0F91_13710 [Flavobacterium sandaracinum]